MANNNGNQKGENALIAERRRKLSELREEGIAYPNDFRRNALAEELHHTYGGHEGEHLREENIHVKVSGRMMVKRVMGKSSFIKLKTGPQKSRFAWSAIVLPKVFTKNSRNGTSAISSRFPELSSKPTPVS